MARPAPGTPIFTTLSVSRWRPRTARATATPRRVRADRLAGEYRSLAASTRPLSRPDLDDSGSSPAFGNAQQTNERYKMILGAGGGGLSVAFDMPTLMGRDSDDPRSLGEVGHCGVAIGLRGRHGAALRRIPLGDVTTSMTISGPAVPIFCMYLVAAERQGTDIHGLDGTLQTDISRNTSRRRNGFSRPSHI